MFQIEKFKKLPQHQSLLDRVATVIVEDSRVLGLYVYGSHDSDEFSDIDLSIFFKSDKERESFINDIEETTRKISKVRAETWYSDEIDLYLVIFDPEEIKVDLKFRLVYKDDNPYEYPADILYDPEGHLEKMVKEAPKLIIDIDEADLDRRIKTFFVGLNYLINKICRGELWRAADVIDIYRRSIVQVEDIFARRLQKDYVKVEQKLDKERLALFHKTLFSELTQENLFKAMDAIFEYYD